MIRTITSIFAALFFFSTLSHAQIVTIPDSSFKAYLLSQTAINTNGDNEIQTSEAIAFTDTINCLGLGIHDLTGIEAFVNITALNCFFNNLTTLDVSHNTQLVYLNCCINNLTTLDLSSNPMIVLVEAYINALTFVNYQNGVPNRPYGSLFHNPDLICIQVDPGSFGNSFHIDTSTVTITTTDCNTVTPTNPIAVSPIHNLNIYPNPMTQQSTLNLGKSFQNVAIEIFDAVGKRIWDNQYQNIQQIDLNLSIAKGIYFVKVSTEIGIITTKLIKQ